MRDENLFKLHVSEICVKQIRGNQGFGVHISNRRLKGTGLNSVLQMANCKKPAQNSKI